MIVRPIKEKDYPSYVAFSQSAGIGMTSLNLNKKILQKNIEKSIESFQKKITSPEDELYLFVLENPETKELGGISGIHSTTKEKCYYKIEKRERFDVLHPLCDLNGPSELCSLFILPKFRQLGYGKLLSFSRFLFIASFKERFTTTLSAELRGKINRNTSFLWKSLGERLYPLSFKKLNQTLKEGQNTLKQSLSEYPIYSFLLPKKAQACLAKPHPDSQRALDILIEQGFKITDLINPNDGGPLMLAERDSITTIKKSVVASFGSTALCNEEEEFFIGTTSLEFKAMSSRLKKAKGNISLPELTQKQLNLEPEELIRFTPKRFL